MTQGGYDRGMYKKIHGVDKVAKNRSVKLLSGTFRRDQRERLFNT